MANQYRNLRIWRQNVRNELFYKPSICLALLPLQTDDISFYGLANSNLHHANFHDFDINLRFSKK